MSRTHCACSPGCRFLADEGHAYKLEHDPTPERAEERRKLLSERGRNGAAKRDSNRAAARDDVAGKLSLRTEDDQLRTLEVALRNLMRSKLDAAKVASATAQLVKAAREVLHGELEAKAERLAKLLDQNPTLRRHLGVVG